MTSEPILGHLHSHIENISARELLWQEASVGIILPACVAQEKAIFELE